MATPNRRRRPLASPAAIALAVTLAATVPAAAEDVICGTKDNYAGANPDAQGFIPMRQGPGPSYGQVRLVREGTPVRILSERSGWFEVSDPSGLVGWIYGNFVCQVRD